jgi:hypothetical protein
VQVFNGLINHFYRNRYLFRSNELGNWKLVMMAARSEAATMTSFLA